MQIARNELAGTRQDGRAPALSGRNGRNIPFVWKLALVVGSWKNSPPQRATCPSASTSSLNSLRGSLCRNNNNYGTFDMICTLAHRCRGESFTVI